MIYIVFFEYLCGSIISKIFLGLFDKISMEYLIIKNIKLKINKQINRKIRMKKFLTTLLIILKIKTWWSHGHLLITRIAELQLPDSILQKTYNLLSPIQDYFPETPNSLLEASLIPDLLVNEYSGFLEFFHFTDQPIIYWNDRKKDINIPDEFRQNITYALELVKNTIKKSLGDELEIGKGFMDSLFLRYLLHLVGDIHQPLHCASLFSVSKFDGKIKNGDLGGNLIKVYDPINKEIINLHAYWDSVLGLYNLNPDLPLSGVDKVLINSQAEKLMKDFPIKFFDGKDKILDEKLWAKEGLDIANSFVYRDADFFPNLTVRYIEEGRDIATQRIVLAGYRLANVIKEIFGEDYSKEI